MDFRDRLTEALRVSGKSRVQLAKDLGISPVTISHWFTGKVTGMRGQTATRFEAATGVRAAWILTGEGPKLVRDTSEAAIASQGIRYIPCLDAAGVVSWWENSGSAPDHSEWLLSNRQHSRRVFALRVDDGAIRQDFPAGDHVIVDPEVRPEPGSFVVAIVEGLGAVIRKYRLRSLSGDSAAFDLAPSDENYPVICSTDVHVSFVGTVVEHRRYLDRLS